MKLKDQLGEIIVLDHVPKRIISLVPSITELLHYLGLEEETVGITKFCIHPDYWFQEKTRIGGTKQVDIPKVRELKPGLIIANKEENTKEDIALLKSIAPVYVSDINSISDCVQFLKDLGELLARPTDLETLIFKINESLEKSRAVFHSKSVAYFIWDDPMYLAGKNTFIDSMMQWVGLRNVSNENRYPMLDLEKTETPDLVFLSSEPFPFQDKHLSKYQALFPRSKICLVDGEMFSWYGSRLLHFSDYVLQLKAEMD